MITLFHLIRLAIHNLFRGGQRVLVALLCITFGIMSLVAMIMVAQCIENKVVLTPAQLLGGDISMGRKIEENIRLEDLDQLKTLEQNGAMSRYTLIAYNSSIMFHVLGSGDMHFVGNGMGIEPDKYPLAGSLVIGEPGSTGLQTLLQQVGDVVPTRDVAEEYKLKVGDRIVLADLHTGVPIEGKVRGIAFDTPNHQGDKLYYSVATAQKLANGQAVVNTVIVNTDQPKALTDQLESSGWSVNWAAGRGFEKTANLWVIGLKGAGILGLLVGGIGIANTMQVLLRRRQREIAIWKTLGYREGDLRLLFSLEAGLLGLAGSLLGAVMGVLISTALLEIFRRTSTLLYEWTFSLTPPLMGVLVGTLSTVIFAYWAILISSQARPMALLRNEAVEIQSLPGCQSVLLGLLLAVPFTVLTSLIMGSVLSGIGVLIEILIGLGLLGGFFRVVLWLCTHLLPLRGFPLLRMALNSLQRGGTALVFAMIALFIGVISMSLGLVVTQKSEREMAGLPVDFKSYNLNILATASQENSVRQVVEKLHPEKVGVGYRTAVESLSVDGHPVANTEQVLVGRSDPEDYTLSGADWTSQPVDGVYVSKWANLKTGSQVRVNFHDGTTRIFTVVGAYEINVRTNNLFPPNGLLMTASSFNQVTRPDSFIYFIQVAPNQVSQATRALGAALPEATVVNLVAYAGRFMRSYQNLFVLAIAMAGLALLAGLLLVANSVSLAILDRRYEIGILKTVGYSRRQILSIFAVEYGLVGLLATVTGVLLIQCLLAMVVIADHLPAAYLLLNVPSLALVTFCGIGLTLMAVLGVTWEPTRISPSVVLNEGNG